MPEKEQSENFWREPLQVFIKISGWVVTPVVVSLFLGKFLDEKFNTAPIIFLALTAFAFLISCFGIYKEAMHYLQHIEKTHGTTRNNNDK